jgi:hypothetical protein
VPDLASQSRQGVRGTIIYLHLAIASNVSFESVDVAFWTAERSKAYQQTSFAFRNKYHMEAIKPPL